jgi:hypothetical protein
MPLRHLVAHGIGKCLDGLVAGNAVSGEVQRGVEVGEGHLAAPSQQAEGGPS